MAGLNFREWLGLGTFQIPICSLWAFSYRHFLLRVMTEAQELSQLMQEHLNHRLVFQSLIFHWLKHVVKHSIHRGYTGVHLEERGAITGITAGSPLSW